NGSADGRTGLLSHAGRGRTDGGDELSAGDRRLPGPRAAIAGRPGARRRHAGRDRLQRGPVPDVRGPARLALPRRRPRPATRAGRAVVGARTRRRTGAPVRRGHRMGERGDRAREDRMPRMTGGQAALAALRAHDVEVVFGVPGVHTLPFYDAMYDEPGVRHVL